MSESDTLRQRTPLEKEDLVRKTLEREFLTFLPKMKVNLVHGSSAEINLCSREKGIFGEVKTTRLHASGNYPKTKIGNVTSDLVLLMGVKRAKKRIFVFTDRDFYEWFKDKPWARIAESKGIEIRLCEVD
jgi:hypothetical protein